MLLAATGIIWVIILFITLSSDSETGFHDRHPYWTATLWTIGIWVVFIWVLASRL